VLSQLVRRATQLIVQEALEAEQADFIGREHYQRGEGRGYRSGYLEGPLDTAEGRISVQRPKCVRPASPIARV
jgi:transposase-like protein